MQRKYPVVVGVYTNHGDGLYAGLAQKLRSNLSQLGMEHRIEERSTIIAGFSADMRARLPSIPPESKVPIYRYLVWFCEEMLNHYKRPILFVSLDSKFQRKPPAAEFEPFDVMFSLGWGADAKKVGILASPVYYRPSKTATHYLEAQKYLCWTLDNRHVEHPIMAHLAKVFQDPRGGYSIGPFPSLMSSRRKNAPEDADPHIWY
jgi:hypothetical protein